MKLLTTSEVAQILGYKAKYVRDSLKYAPDFPKPIIHQNARGGYTQPRWRDDQIKAYVGLV